MTRQLQLLVCLALLAFAAMSCSSEADQEGTVEGLEYLDSVKPVCVELPNSPNPPCARRVFWTVDTYPDVHGSFSSELLSRLPLQVEGEYRIDWTGDSGLGAPQLILRGVVIPGSARCTESRAMVVNAQRYYKIEVNSDAVDEVCFVDISVNEYITGRGPSIVTAVAGWRNGVSTGAADYGTSTYYDRIAAPIRESLEGIEFVFDLSRPHNLSFAEWQFTVHRLWDVQRKGDGTIVGVSWWVGIFGSVADVSSFEYPLEDLQNMMRSARSKLAAEFGGRIGDSDDSPMLVSDANREFLMAQIRELGGYDAPGITPVAAPTATVPRRSP